MNIHKPHLCQLLLVALPAGVYYGFILRFAVDMPYGDDHQDILAPLVEYIRADTWLHGVEALYQQHNEHRTTFGRLVALVLYLLAGELDFVVLITFGNLAMFGWVLLMGSPRAIREHIPLSTFIAALIILQPQCVQSAYWAMAAISNYWVVLLSLTALYLLTLRTSKAFAGACAAAVLATFTQGNGQLVWAIGAVYLITAPHPGSRKSVTLGTWAATGLFAVGLFYAGYEAGDYALQRAVAWEMPVHLAHRFVAIFGASVGGDEVAYSTIAGSVVCLCVAAVFASGLHRRYAFLASSLAFLVLSAVMIAFSRAPFPVEQALISRYRLYSTLTILPLVLIAGTELCRRVPKHKATVTGTIIAMAAVFNVTSYVGHLDEVQRQERARLSERRALVATGRAHRPNIDRAPSRHQRVMAKRRQLWNEIMTSARAVGIFEPSDEEMNE